MRTRGYTLVEMMVVVALLSIVGVAVVAMFLTTSRGGGKAGAIALVKQEGDYALTTMERYIHFAKSVDTATCDVLGTSSMSIVVRDEDPANPDKRVVFDMNGTNQIQRTITTLPAGTPVAAVLTSNKVEVSGLEFICAQSTNGVTTVDVDFMVTPIGGDVVTENFHTRVVLRNKN
jgi:prepilin-type N-terminal cleavage/methylation domain-containing protein